MRVLHLDIETYSSAPLPKCGVYRYCGSPDFEILLLSYAFDDGPVVTADLACGEQIPDEFLHALEDTNVLKIAHPLFQHPLETVPEIAEKRREVAA